MESTPAMPMTTKLLAPDLAERIEADIRAVGRPPATDEQIGRVLASLPETLNGKPVAKRCPRCGFRLGSGRDCDVCQGSVVTMQRDEIADARNHIRAALRGLAALNQTINAYAGDDDFGQPNRATAAMDELALALDSL